MRQERKPKVTERQVQYIKMLQKQNDISEEEYKRLLEQKYSVSSSKALTKRQAIHFIEYLKARPKTVDKTVKKSSYPSTREGLIQELEHYAYERWGTSYEMTLNHFVNSHRGATIAHYKFLPIAELKAFKERIRYLNEQEKKAIRRALMS